MALVEQVIDIPLQMGLDLQNHSFLVDNARFLFLQDVIFDKGSLGQLHKRNGHTPLTTSTCAITGFPSLSLNTLAPEALVQFNNELDLVTGNVLYGQSENGWLPKGNLLAYDFSENQISSSVYNCSCPDMATSNNFNVFAWQENNQVNVKVVDAVTGSVYFQQGLVYGNTTQLFNPKVIATANATLILCNDAATNVYVCSLTQNQPVALTPLTILANFDEPITAFDATIANSVLVLAAMTQVTTTFVSWLLSFNSLTLAPIHAGVAADTNTGVGKAISVVTIGTNVLMSDVWTANNASHVDAYFYTSGLASVQGFTDLNYGNFNGEYPHRITALNNDSTGAASTQALLFIEQAPINAQAVSQVVVYLLDISGDSGHFTPFVGLQLASQPFWTTYANPTKVTLNILATFPSQVQQTHFLMSSINEVTHLSSGADFVAHPMSAVVKAFQSNAGPAPANNRLPQIQSESNIACSNQTYLTSVGGVPTLVNGVASLSLTPSTAVSGTQLGQNLLLTTGGLTYSYDGVDIVEHGFNYFPEAPIATPLKSNITVVTDIQANQQNIYGNAVSPTIQAKVFVSSSVPGKGMLLTAVPAGTSGNNITVILLDDGTGLLYNISGNVVTIHFPPDPTWPKIIVDYINGTPALAAILTATLADNPETDPQLNAGTFVLSGGVNVVANSGPQQVNHIYIPDNPQNPGSGLATTYTDQNGNKVSTPLITPGEYIYFGQNNINAGTPGGVDYPFVFFFVVDGNGGGWNLTTNRNSSLGFPGDTTYVPVYITSSMTATETAQQLVNAMGPSFGFYSSVIFNPIPQGAPQSSTGQSGYPLIPYNSTPGVTAWTPQAITVLGNANCALANPAMNRQFTVLQEYAGDGSGVASTYTVNCCPANLLKGGYYFTFGLSCATSSFNPALIQNGYVWFTIAGVGTDPNPFGYDALHNNVNPLPGVLVALTGNENEVQVAKAIQLVLLDAYFPGAGFGVNVYLSGPTIIVQSVTTDGRAVLPPNQWAAGGTNTTYIDENVDGVVNADSVLYSAVYEWIDGQGQLHQSAPSVPTVAYIFSFLTFPNWVSDQQPGGGSPIPPNQIFQVSTVPLNLTLKSSALFQSTTNADVAFFRSQTNIPQVQYKVTSPFNLIQMSPTQLNYPSFVDYSPDSPIVTNAQAATNVTPTTGISGNTPLYTTGGVIENDAPPASTAIINHQDRIILASAEQPQTLWYSESWSVGLGVAFSELQTIRLNNVVGKTVGGPITGFGSMDGRLIIFQEDAIWYIEGSGPDAAGNGQPFSPPQLVASSTAIGCRDPGSIALIPAGLMFKSSQGFYLLGRNLTLTSIGMPVQQYNSDIVSSSVVLNSNTQVRFLSEFGTTLIYDWFYQSWGTFSTKGVSSILDSASGEYCYLTNNGLVLQEASEVYSDNGVAFPMVITTAWIKLENIQGFGRIWRAYLLGEFPGTEQYQVQISYNYLDPVVDTIIWNTAAGTFTGGLWGSDDLPGTWGNNIGGYWGSAGSQKVSYPNKIQEKLYPSTQLCESIKITFQDTGVLDSTVTPALDALSFVCGIRKGGFKFLGNGNTAG